MPQQDVDPDKTPVAGYTRRVGQYECTAIIGKGGMGTVFLARQEGLERQVALKVLSTRISEDPVFLERFQREARASARLNHPHIVQGIDVGYDTATGFWYFAMEYVDGPSVKSILQQQGVLPERRALEIARDIAQALACADRNGIVHRDIKPDNILIAPLGDAKLTDLGLIKLTQTPANSLTQSGETVGTPFYMAPEQAKGYAERIDVRTDIYSLGCTLFHMLTGHPPYQGDTAPVIMTKHIREKVPLAHREAPGISENCGRLIAKMMAKESEQRYQSAEELLEAIDKLMGREGSSGRQMVSRPLSSNPRLPHVGRRTAASKKPDSFLPLAAVGVGLALLLIAGFVFVATRPGTDTQANAETNDAAEPDKESKDLGAPKPDEDLGPSANQESTAPIEPAPPPPQRPGKVLFGYDFEEASLPSDWRMGTRVSQLTHGGSRGALKAKSTPESKYFVSQIEYYRRDYETFVTVSDRTYLSLAYYVTDGSVFKVQISVEDGSKHYNTHFSLYNVPSGRWNTLKVRFLDGFVNILDNNSRAPVPAGVKVRRFQVYAGKPGQGGELYIDDLVFSEE